MRPDQLTTIAPPPSLRGPLTDAEREVLGGYLRRMEETEQRVVVYVTVGLILQAGLATGFVVFAWGAL